MGSRILGPFVLAALLSGCAGQVAWTSGELHGRVVDAETKQPISGAAVLAVWYRETKVAPEIATDYEDALELLTDANGQFRIPSKTHFSVIGKVLDPELSVYARDHAPFPSAGATPKGAAIGRAYAAAEFPIELRRLTTRKERVEAYHLLHVLTVPNEKMPNLLRLINEDRTALGLEPIRRLGR